MREFGAIPARLDNVAAVSYEEITSGRPGGSDGPWSPRTV
jgi:hypothetical protein